MRVFVHLHVGHGHSLQIYSYPAPEALLLHDSSLFAHFLVERSIASAYLLLRLVTVRTCNVTRWSDDLVGLSVVMLPRKGAAS